MNNLSRSIAAICMFAPLAAFATEGYVVADSSLQAGPDSDYPPIVNLAAGTPVSIQGCIDGWTWCDVIVGNDRGWIAGTYLEENYNSQPVFVTEYGSRIGIPIVAFSLGVYWEQHYHNRPWYAERQQWQSREIHSRPPPRPAGPPPPINHGSVNHGPENHGPENHGPVNQGSATSHEPARAAVATHPEPHTATAPTAVTKPVAHVQPEHASPEKLTSHTAQQTETPKPKAAPVKTAPVVKQVTPPQPVAPPHPPVAKVAPQPKTEAKPPPPKEEKGDTKDHDHEH